MRNPPTASSAMSDVSTTDLVSFNDGELSILIIGEHATTGGDLMREQRCSAQAVLIMQTLSVLTIEIMYTT